MPTPRKKGVASDRIASLKFSVAATRIGIMQLGRMSCSMIRHGLTRISSAALT